MHPPWRGDDSYREPGTCLPSSAGWWPSASVPCDLAAACHSMGSRGGALDLHAHYPCPCSSLATTSLGCGHGHSSRGSPLRWLLPWGCITCFRDEPPSALSGVASRTHTPTFAFPRPSCPENPLPVLCTVTGLDIFLGRDPELCHRSQLGRIKPSLKISACLTPEPTSAYSAAFFKKITRSVFHMNRLPAVYCPLRSLCRTGFFYFAKNCSHTLFSHDPVLCSFAQVDLLEPFYVQRARNILCKRRSLGFKIGVSELWVMWAWRVTAEMSWAPFFCFRPQRKGSPRR